MSVFPGWEQEGGPPPVVPPDVDVYAHIEGLVGEEEWLEDNAREPHHHERLAEVRQSLDRLRHLLDKRRQKRA
jgi:hypothetical protein